MNNTLYSGFETNFNNAVKMCCEEYDYQQLINFLSSGRILEKQIAALRLNEIKSKEDAMVLVSNLTGQDGKVREASAFKINELIENPSYAEFFTDEKIFDIFLQGLMDINGNVCRLIACGCMKNHEFKKYLCEKLPDVIKQILEKTDKTEANSKQYVISKIRFQLYWCLEALYGIANETDLEKIVPVLLKTGEFSDYTIREKTAKVLTKINCLEVKKLRKKLNNDKNYYVKRYSC